ncbi:diguanylate cyclase domain-containing protein [Aquihabitans daechungensis]|uniref:diguanylate cyclase domain-containing protein n=1 Tax=Aquihabitans daechungensis TaxID=1052257 RepID=UPI003B9F7F29
MVRSTMRLHPSGFGLRTRLLALVLLPALLLAGVGGAVVLQQLKTAQTITEVQTEVGVLADLTELRRALLEARTPVEIEVRAKEIGVDQDTALRLLGIDEPATAGLDDVAARLGSLPPDARPFSTARLDGIRAASERSVDLALIDQFDQLDALARQRWEQRLRRLRTDVVDTGNTGLNHRLDDLESSTRGGSAAITMVTELADYWFGTLADDDRAGPARAGVAVASQQFDQALAELAASTDADVAAAAEEIAADRSGTPFDAAVDDAVAGRPPAPLADGADLEAIAATFTSSADLFGPLLEIMEERTAQLDASATALAEEATREARISALGLIVALVALLVVSLAVAASLDQPLSRLIEGMRRVGEGDLDVGPLPVEGPVEFAEATAAFNDVVSNLNRIEGKVDALANAELDDPRLQEPLPGALGDSMQRSIQLLSDSVADRDALQERLAFQATHDALTLLPNRLGALEALDGAIARSSRSGAPLAVLFLDLDGFKAVNDTFGHQTGDDVLCEVARRLDEEARTGDFCARLGGDEFVIIAENVAGPEGAAALARRVTHRIAEPYAVGPAGLKQTNLGVSIGIAMRDLPNDTPLSVVNRADEAAYRAKRAGSGVEIAS